MAERVIKAALLGFGTVGGGVYKVLKMQQEEMVSKLGARVELKKILVRNIEKAAQKTDDPSLLTNNWKEIVDDPEIEIVIELIGGIEPARTYILEALEAGKNVVTANKDLIAADGQVYQKPVPKGTLVNGVGAGDSMVAGFMAGCAER